LRRRIFLLDLSGSNHDHRNTTTHYLETGENTSGLEEATADFSSTNRDKM
jgi:hypothetical protein